MVPPTEVGKCRHPDPAFHWQGQPAHLSMRWNSGSAAVLQNARLLKDHLAKGPLFARQPFRQDNRKRKTHIHQINHAPLYITVNGGDGRGGESIYIKGFMVGLGRGWFKPVVVLSHRLITANGHGSLRSYRPSVVPCHGHLSPTC